MTLTQADFEAQLQAAIDDYEIQERYKAQDPLVVHQLRSIASFLTAFGQSWYEKSSTSCFYCECNQQAFTFIQKR